MCRVIRDYGTFAGFTSQCLPINIETAIFQPPSNADALLDLESLRVLKGLADDDAPFLQMRGLIENTANELTPLQEKLTLETIREIIILGKWFTTTMGGLIAGNPDGLIIFLEEYSEFIGDLQFCAEDLVFDPHSQGRAPTLIQTLIDAGKFRQGPMWKFLYVDTKNRLDDRS